MPHSPVSAPWFKINKELWNGQDKERLIVHDPTVSSRGELLIMLERMSNGAGGYDWIPLRQWPDITKLEDQFTGGIWDSENDVYFADNTWTDAVTSGPGVIRPHQTAPWQSGVELQTGGTDGDWVRLQTGQWLFSPYGSVLDYSYSCNSSLNQTINTGFLEDPTTTQYAKVTSTTGGNLYFRTNDGAFQESTDLGLASNTYRPCRVTIVLNGATNAKCYIDGVLKATHTVRLPSNNLTVGFFNQTNQNAQNSLYVYYCNAHGNMDIED